MRFSIRISIPLPVIAMISIVLMTGMTAFQI
jgi:hypothetical protein